jgi:hypothetical protein
MIAFVISETFSRYAHALRILHGVGFSDVIHMPAVFHDEPHCKGNNGHRMAFRNMWRLILHMNTTACIFEDDIALLNPHFRATQVRMKSYNFYFLGEFWKRKRWWTNHAACMTPSAARTQLKYTEKCIRKRGESIDRIIKKLCSHRILKCKPASRYKIVTRENITWLGDFYQNRSISSYLHDANNSILLDRHVMLVRS